MTQEESKSIKKGDSVLYLGKESRVDDISVTGCDYHPYFKLTPLVYCNKSLTSKIANGYICYAVCGLFKEVSSEPS